MAKDIYLIMKQYALLSPKLSRGETKKSLLKPGSSEPENQSEKDVDETKVDLLAQQADVPVQIL